MKNLTIDNKTTHHHKSNNKIYHNKSTRQSNLMFLEALKTHDPPSKSKFPLLNRLSHGFEIYLNLIFFFFYDSTWIGTFCGKLYQRDSVISFFLLFSPNNGLGYVE